jgi:hypothetical protein
MLSTIYRLALQKQQSPPATSSVEKRSYAIEVEGFFMKKRGIRFVDSASEHLSLNNNNIATATSRSIELMPGTRRGGDVEQGQTPSSLPTS